MRRNLPSIVLFSLALAIQVLAPATSGLAESVIPAAGFCLTASAVSDAPTKGSLGHFEARAGLCDLCAAGCGGVALLPSRTLFTAFGSLDWTSAEWTAPAPIPTAARPDHARRARAPPFPIRVHS